MFPADGAGESKRDIENTFRVFEMYPARGGGTRTVFKMASALIATANALLMEYRARERVTERVAFIECVIERVTCGIRGGTRYRTRYFY